MTHPSNYWLLGLRLSLLGLAIGLVAIPVYGLQSDWLAMLEKMREMPSMLFSVTLVYAICLAVPYVPGVELGLMIMLIFGRTGILMAWIGTVIGLTLAFSIGVWFRTHFRDSDYLRRWRSRAKDFRVESNQQLQQTNVGAWLATKIAKFKSASPYLLLGALFNLPGNWLIGGGGGIALVGGLSGKLRWLPYVLTVMIATAGVPILVWLGVIELERWLPN